MKTSIINTRISSSLKEELEILSQFLSIPISNIVREALENHLTNSIDNHKNDLIIEGLNSADIELLQSLSFTELIFWLYDKKRDPAICEIIEFYEGFIKLIEEINQHPLFTDEILIEFNKVLFELNHVLNEWSGLLCGFKFPESFDYLKLSNFIHAIRYDDENNKVIHIK
jgi:predicted DNA-binding protein